jgi:hypothetical protein
LPRTLPPSTSDDSDAVSLLVDHDFALGCPLAATICAQRNIEPLDTVERFFAARDAD